MKRHSTLIMMIFAGLLASACGHKTKLTPPPPRRIEPVTGLTAEIQCGKIALRWKPVAFTNRAEPIEGPVKYLVLRRRGERISSAGETLPDGTGTPIPTTTPTATPTSTPAPDPVTGLETPVMTPTPQPQPEYEFKLIGIIDTPEIVSSPEETLETVMEFIDDGKPGVTFLPAIKFRTPPDFPPDSKEKSPDLIPGFTYYYKIQAVGPRQLTSEPSEPVDVTYILIPGPPEEFDGALTETGVTLTWTAPAGDCHHTDDTDVAGFYVEKALVQAPDNFLMFAEIEATSDLTVVDQQIIWDTEYFYRIRAFSTVKKIPGEYAPLLTVATRDSFPPKNPAKLRAAAAQGGVHLVWQANQETDLAGYRIYRSIHQETDFQCISGNELVTDTVYMDNKVVSGEVYYYRVTAVDLSNSRNESAASPTVRIFMP